MLHKDMTLLLLSVKFTISTPPLVCSNKTRTLINMQNKPTRKEITAFIIGIIIGGLFVYQISNVEAPHVDSFDTAYHIHADFLVYVQDKKIELDLSKFMTTAEQSLHGHVHLHDDNGDVIHMHAEDVTLAEFMHSLGFTLDNDCFSLQDGEQYCNDEDSTLQLLVNGTQYGNIVDYVPTDEDNVLLFYGTTNSIEIANYLGEITDDACYYSGTCPERGIAPSESCGLTCEL